MSFDDVLDEEFCDKLIDQFDNSSDSQHMRLSEYSWSQDYRRFTELNISKEYDFKWAHEEFYAKTKQLSDYYKQKCQAHFFPSSYGYEDARMKKYLNNNRDQFGWHVDVGDYASARRFLVIFFYLNDVEVGGETVFNIEDDSFVQVTPKRGRIVMFPPTWMFPHIGTKPVSGSKYIVSTYLHYL